MIKLQFKLPQALISRGFTRRTVFHAPAFQQKGINRLMDIYQINCTTCIQTISVVFYTEEEATFNDFKTSTNLTSNHHPSNVILNAIVRAQVSQRENVSTVCLDNLWKRYTPTLENVSNCFRFEETSVTSYPILQRLFHSRSRFIC